MLFRSNLSSMPLHGTNQTKSSPLLPSIHIDIGSIFCNVRDIKLILGLCIPPPITSSHDHCLLTPSDPHPIDLPPTSRLYKSLLQGGHYNHTTNSVERASDATASTFASHFVQIVGKDATVAMCVGDGNGAFVVAELCEALIRGDLTEEKGIVKEWFSEKVVQEIEAGQAKGKRLLLDKLALL